MVALAARDSERVLRFVAEAEKLGGDDPFTPRFLEALGTLIPADWIGYEERDFARSECLVSYDFPAFEDVYGGLEFDVCAAREENPLRRHHLDGHFEATRLLDLLPPQALRRTRYHGLVLAPLGVTDILTVAIPSHPSRSKRFLFDRKGGSFSQRDRYLLDALQPHLGRVWRTARTRRRLRAALATLASASEQDPRGLIVVTPDGRIDFASPPARRLIREHFAMPPEGELPPTLAQWLHSDSPMLTRQFADRCLTIERSGDTLLLEEVRDEPGLTPREHQILTLVAQGKTNPQIAEILWIAPRTVRKHLENIYAKLGVHTRTAAVTRLLGILEDETE